MNIYRSEKHRVLTNLMSVILIITFLSQNLAFAGEAPKPACLAPAYRDGTAREFIEMCHAVEEGQSGISSTLSLTDIFGKGAIHSVLDVGIGQGEWMRAIRKTSWLAPDATVRGLELKDPKTYEDDPATFKQKYWPGLTVTHGDKNAPNYPIPGTVDLIHEGFMDLEEGFTFEGMLEEYDSILADNGWMLISQNYKMSLSEWYESWLKKNGYEVSVFWDFSGIPTDYPKSRWWSIHTAFSGRFGLCGNYLIVAKKVKKCLQGRQGETDRLAEQLLSSV